MQDRRPGQDRKTAAAFRLAAVCLSLAVSAPACAAPLAVPAAPAPTYADLADLSDSAPLVVRAQVRQQAVVEPARALGVRAGWARLYVKAATQALLAGRQGVGETLSYLVDVPLDARGRPPKLRKQSVLLFGRAVPGHPDELQLVRPDAQLAWTPDVESRLRSVLTELAAANAPQRITGVREAIHVPGNLAGEGETQLFLSTGDQSAASIVVTREPNAAPTWGVSFSELVPEAASAPRRDTLAWYRLACFLPRELPLSANIAPAPEDKEAAVADYRFVIEQLGQCPRTLS